MLTRIALLTKVQEWVGSIFKKTIEAAARAAVVSAAMRIRAFHDNGGVLFLQERRSSRLPLEILLSSRE
ncbi:hypothetical protein D0Y65_036863 [Glycine soja]|uniref:Uncharacterized protein n=1 Tax=Glycine soja TaxID=3848 RepID=A0A445HGR2_GLYSO|nr:hypothetical protein D0Y65_036863 [Glycine soja]